MLQWAWKYRTNPEEAPLIWVGNTFLQKFKEYDHERLMESIERLILSIVPSNSSQPKLGSGNAHHVHFASLLVRPETMLSQNWQFLTPSPLVVFLLSKVYIVNRLSLYDILWLIFRHWYDKGCWVLTFKADCSLFLELVNSFTNSN